MTLVTGRADKFPCGSTVIEYRQGRPRGRNLRGGANPGSKIIDTTLGQRRVTGRRGTSTAKIQRVAVKPLVALCVWPWTQPPQPARSTMQHTEGRHQSKIFAPPPIAPSLGSAKNAIWNRFHGEFA